jgi:hypothetical protein
MAKVVCDPNNPVLYLRQPTDDQLEAVLAWCLAKKLQVETCKECTMQWEAPFNYCPDAVAEWDTEDIKRWLVDAGVDPGKSRRPGLIKKLTALNGTVSMLYTIAISLSSNADPSFHAALKEAYPPDAWGINCVVEIAPQPPEGMEAVLAAALGDPSLEAQDKDYPVADDGKMPY